MKNKNKKTTQENHGMSRTRIYYIWKYMRQRVYNPNDDAYPRYGGSGVGICDRWDKFENFHEDMGEEYREHVEEYGEDNTTIDRIDNGGDYCPDNCRWATRKQQQRNRKNIDTYEYNGDLYTLTELGEIANNNLTFVGIKKRIERGMSVEEAITKPSMK